MGRLSVSQIIASIRDVGGDLGEILADKKQDQKIARGHFDSNYETVRKGILTFVTSADGERLSALTHASARAGKPTNFTDVAKKIRGRNDEIRRELEQFVDDFGEVASIPLRGEIQRTPKLRLTADELEKKLAEEIYKREGDWRILRLAICLIKRGQKESGKKDDNHAQFMKLEKAEEFLELCRERHFFGFLRPTIRHGRYLNRLKKSGEYDALAEIKEVLRHKEALAKLRHVTALKAEYKDQKQLDIALRDSVIEAFNSPDSFSALDSVLPSELFSPLQTAFSRAVDAKRDLKAIEPQVALAESNVNATVKDTLLLTKIKDHDDSLSIEFDKGAYPATIQDGRSGYTQSFQRILNELEEQERKRQEAARLKREAEDAAAAAASSSSSSTTISIGGGFSGGGGSSGGGGASGGWITSDIEAEPGFAHSRRFEI